MKGSTCTQDPSLWRASCGANPNTGIMGGNCKGSERARAAEADFRDACCCCSLYWCMGWAIYSVREEAKNVMLRVIMRIFFFFGELKYTIMFVMRLIWECDGELDFFTFTVYTIKPSQEFFSISILKKIKNENNVSASSNQLNQPIN